MKINQLKLQTPFLQPDLLTVSSFISYCDDNGVSTDNNELEYFEKEMLLLPAVRVLMGVVEYRSIFANFSGKEEWRHIYANDIDKFKVKKLDPKKYYGRGSLIQSVPGLGEIRGFHFGNDGWMDWYIKHDMVRYPAQEGYTPWERFSEPDKEGQVFASDPKLYDEVSELMYAKHQIYLLKLIKSKYEKTQRILKPPKGYPHAGELIVSTMSSNLSKEELQQQILEWNNFFSFFIEARKLRNGKHQRINEVYKQSFNENGRDHDEASKDAISSGKIYDEQARVTANKIINKQKLSIKKIEDWREKILDHGSFGTGSRARVLRAYISSIDNSLLNSTEDCYAIVNELSWFIELIGGTGITAKQLLLNSIGETCKYCGKSFKPIRFPQYTCGSKECKQKQRNEHKREDRKIAKARSNTISP